MNSFPSDGGLRFAAALSTSSDTAAAIDGTLDGGGHALVVVEIGALLRKGGVLDRLKASGVAITGP